LTREQIIVKCNLGGIAYGRISDMEQLSNHPQNLYMNVETPNGIIQVLASGAQHDGKLPQAGSIPRIDENGATIRKEFK